MRIVTRGGYLWISVPKLEALPEPPVLDALKGEVARRWGRWIYDALMREREITGYGSSARWAAAEDPR